MLLTGYELDILRSKCNPEARGCLLYTSDAADDFAVV